MRLAGHGLGCVRGGRNIFSALDFEVAAGQALAVTGVNGAGKSSLLRMIAGLLPAASGTITLQGPETDLTLPEQTHYLGHRDALKPSLSVLENLEFWRAFLGGDVTDATASLEAVGLAHAIHLPAGFLSAGQRRRLSIARLLAVRRPVWLLDEPASALDAKGQTMVAALMADHLTRGGIILAATHGPLGISAQELRIGGDA
jgi:heme exporter protein A